MTTGPLSWQDAGVTIIRAARPCTVVVCRDCCCGSARKYPGTDHDGQLATLREAATASEGAFTVRTSDCLGICEHANVLVVQPSTQGRTRGGKIEWLGFALDEGITQDVLEYARAGGPGVAEPPATLELYRVPAPTDPIKGKAARKSRRKQR